MGAVAVLLETSNQGIRSTSLPAISAARELAKHHGGPVVGVVIGTGAELGAAATDAARYVDKVLKADNAALAQPLAVGFHAVDRSRIRQGDVVVVHGAGAIGSFVVAGAVAAGAGAVVAVDVDPGRLEVATRLGATHTVDAREADPLEAVRELTGPALADVTVEASGLADGMSRVQRLTRRGGTVLLVGLPKKEVSFNAVDLILREIDVMTTVAHVCDTNLPAALDLLAQRDLASLLVEKVVPLDHAVEDALVPMAEGAARGKLLVDTEVTA